MSKGDAGDLMCAKCGTRLRTDWYRCPRCREVIAAPMPAPPPVSTPPPARNVSSKLVHDAPRAEAGARWPIVVALLAASVASFVGSLVYEFRKYPGPIIERPAASEAATPSAEPSAQVAPAPVRRTVDASALVAEVASDAVRWGKAALADGDLDQAEAQFEAALAAGADDADVRNGLGEVLFKKRRVDEAIAEFDRAIALDAGRFAFRLNRARARALQHQWAGAAEDYRVAAQRRPDDYATHYNLGLALLELQRYDAASRALERAITLAPEESALLVPLGTAYAAADRHELARSAFERFLERAPDDAEAPHVREMLTALTSTPE